MNENERLVFKMTFKEGTGNKMNRKIESFLISITMFILILVVFAGTYAATRNVYIADIAAVLTVGLPTIYLYYLNTREYKEVLNEEDLGVIMNE
jgi:hypothetical protein